jgi:hypothetical protein
MRLYNQQHRFYAGVDLHARSMFTHVLDHAGRTVFDKDLPASPDTFLDSVRPFRPGLVVGCECMFAWYWLADLWRTNSGTRFSPSPRQDFGEENRGFAPPGPEWAPNNRRATGHVPITSDYHHFTPGRRVPCLDASASARLGPTLSEVLRPYLNADSKQQAPLSAGLHSPVIRQFLTFSCKSSLKVANILRK